MQVFGLVMGSGALPASLFFLDREPWFGVLGRLGAMALLLGSLVKLGDASRAESNKRG